MTWSEANDVGADAGIAAQVSRFAELSRPWEWKHYSYGPAPHLPDRLHADGFTRQPAEALLVAEIADLTLDMQPLPACSCGRSSTDKVTSQQSIR